MHMCPRLCFFSKRKQSKPKKVTPTFSGPINRHCVVTAALVATYMQRLVVAITPQPLRSQTCIGTYCICIIDQTQLLCILCITTPSAAGMTCVLQCDGRSLPPIRTACSCDATCIGSYPVNNVRIWRHLRAPCST